MRLYRAVIENNKDPEEQGRYQVRIFGLQDGNKSGFETTNTEELPWAECIGTTAFGLIGEVGVSSIMHQGTWVYVILQDNDPNLPIILGTVIGNATKETAGFGDPDKAFPQKEGLDLGFISGEKYNFNQTIKTQSGHYIEIDDSKDDERIHVYHRTGTYVLIDKEGDIYINGVRDAHYTIARDVTWEIGRDLTMHVAGNATYTIDGNRQEKIGGTSQINVGGSLTETIGGTATFDVSMCNFTNNIHISNTSTADTDHLSAGISGAHHTHDVILHSYTSPPK